MAHRIVILGAGYAGSTAAKRVATRLPNTTDVQVTLVNARAWFMERLSAGANAHTETHRQRRP